MPVVSRPNYSLDCSRAELDHVGESHKSHEVASDIGFASCLLPVPSTVASAISHKRVGLGKLKSKLLDESIDTGAFLIVRNDTTVGLLVLGCSHNFPGTNRFGVSVLLYEHRG